MVVMILFFLLFFLWKNSVKSEELFPFEVSHPERIISNQENSFQVFSPVNGSLCIVIRDEHTVYRKLFTEVTAGEQQVKWDGCGYNGERLLAKNYNIDCILTDQFGGQWNDSFIIRADVSAQAILYALPSSDTLNLFREADWFLETRLIMDGYVSVEAKKEGMRESKKCGTFFLTGGKCHVVDGKKLFGSAIREEGRYFITLTEKEHPGCQRSFWLTVTDEEIISRNVFITGEIVPQSNMTENEIWEMMQMPSVVVDIPFEKHQDVLAEPEADSFTLGTLHGQTQAVSVLKTDEKWTKVGAWNHEEGEYIEGWVPTSKLKVVYPQRDYGLLLNKKEQTLAVYYRGEKVDTLLVSTGRMEKNELYQETAAGSFLTGLHRSDYSTNGKKYDYVIQYDGGNLLHQIPYYWGEGKKDFSAGKPYLGTKASHACIRIQAEPGDGGVNAYWIWTNIPYHTRIIILDDPEERKSEKALLKESVTYDPDSNLVDDATEHEETLKAVSRVNLTFGGDCVLGGRENYFRRNDSLIGKVLSEPDFHPFAKLQSVFEADDITCVNLECVLKDDSNGEDMSKAWRFRGPAAYADYLKTGFVEMVNLANNHTMDYGPEGYSATLDALQGYTDYCGNGHLRVIQVCGHRIGFGGCREAVFLKNPETIEEEIRLLRKMGAEWIVYQCHWGTEYAEHRTVLQEAMARACVRAGANLVVGHHPHTVQGIDVIDGVPIIYSLGNLCFGGTIDVATFDGLLLRAEIAFSENSVTTELKLIPVLTSSSSHQGINDYMPVIAQGEDKDRILRRIQKDTSFTLRENYIVEQPVYAFPEEEK